MTRREAGNTIIRQWLDKADIDMKTCELLLATSPPLLFPVCFHAQQAAEKYLKALLTFHEIDFPKTHDIERLLELLEQADAKTTTILDDSAYLTPYGVDIRYPGDMPEPNLAEAKEAVDLARKVRDAVIGILTAR